MQSLPSDQWQKIQDALNKIDARSPNAQDYNAVRSIRAAIFVQAQGYDKGQALSDAINRALNPPKPPEPILMDLGSQVDRQVQFLQSHMDQLPIDQFNHIHDLMEGVNRANPSLADLQALQQASHQAFGTVQDPNIKAAAQALSEAANANAGMVWAQRINAAAQGTAMVLMLPVAASAGLGALGLQVGESALATGAAMVTVPGASAAIAQTAAWTFAGQALGGAASGYLGTDYGGGKQGAVWGVAQATLPVNTAAALLHGENVGNVIIATMQDTGNVFGAIGAANHLREMATTPLRQRVGADLR